MSSKHIPKRILTDTQAENIRQAFAAKFALDRSAIRTQYFGPLRDEVSEQLHLHVKQCEFDYVDPQGSGFTVHSINEDSTEVKRLVSYPIVAMATVTKKYDCPLSLRKMIQYHCYYLTKKMWDEVQQLSEI